MCHVFNKNLKDPINEISAAKGYIDKRPEITDSFVQSRENDENSHLIGECSDSDLKQHLEEILGMLSIEDDSDDMEAYLAEMGVTSNLNHMMNEAGLAFACSPDVKQLTGFRFFNLFDIAELSHNNFENAQHC